MRLANASLVELQLANRARQIARAAKHSSRSRGNALARGRNVAGLASCDALTTTGTAIVAVQLPCLRCASLARADRQPGRHATQRSRPSTSELRSAPNCPRALGCERCVAETASDELHACSFPARAAAALSLVHRMLLLLLLMAPAAAHVHCVEDVSCRCAAHLHRMGTIGHDRRGVAWSVQRQMRCV